MMSLQSTTSPKKPVSLPLVRDSHSTNNFDFLRFLGASFVIYGHAYPLSNRGNFDQLQLWSEGLFPTAHMGVAMFFVISGYLISKSLGSSTSGLNFVWKRVLRIFPGLLVAALVTIFILGALATTLPLSEYFRNSATYKYLMIVKLYPPYPNSLPGVFDKTTDVTVNNSIWTLAYEFTCYLALLGMGLFFSKNKGKWILALFVVLWSSFFLWFKFLADTPLAIPLLHLNIFNLIDFSMYFLGGSILYFYKDYVPVKGYLALGMGALWIGVYLITQRFPAIPLSAIVWVRYLAIPYLVLYLAFLKGPLNHFGYFGDISYGLYIYAYPVQRMVVEAVGATAPITQIVFLSFLFTLPLAWLSWRFVERPFLRLKNVLL